MHTPRTTVRPPERVRNLLEEQHLKSLVEAVKRRAQAKGFILPKEVKEELASAGLAEGLWKEVLNSARPVLQYHGGRYYFVPGVSPRRQEHEEMHLQVRAWLQSVAKQQKEVAEGEERRGSERVTFVQPVTLTAEDGASHRALSKDLSPSGIRFIGSKNMLGQKLKATLSSPTGSSRTFWIRIVWACEVGDALYENGGTFVELVPADDAAAAD